MIDTQVVGDPPACRGVAEWLTSYADNAQAAADGCADATSAAEAGWSGPAGEAFRAAVTDPRLLSGDIVTTCTWYGRALSEFADELDGVLALMAQARDDAEQGGLEVDGMVILPPDPPAGAPPQFIGPVDVDAFYEAYTAYNEKVDVYNQCVDTAADARRKEAEAHERLRGTLQPTRCAPTGFEGEPALRTWLDGGTEIKSAVSAYVKAADMGIEDALRQGEQLTNQGKLQLLEALTTHSALDVAEGMRAEQFRDLLRDVPKSVREALRAADAYEWGAALNELARGNPEDAVKKGVSEATLAAVIKGGLKIRKLTPAGLVLSALGADAVINYAVDKAVGFLMPGEDEPNPYAQRKLEHRWPHSYELDY